MTKARILANLISDNAELADGQISVAEVVGAAPLANPTFTGNVDLGDNVRIRLGDSDDLEIYHSGQHSYITENSTGDLYIQGTNIGLRKGDGTQTYLYANAGGSVDIKYNNATKLATSSTGVDITGRAVTDGVTVDGYLDFQTDGTFPVTGLLLHTNNHFYMRGGSNGIIFGDPSGNEYLRFTGGTVFNEGGLDRDFRVESNNNANMLFVDGGTDRIGIGTSLPSTFIHAKSSGDIQFRFETTSDSTAQIQYKNGNNQWSAGIDNLEQFFVYDSTNAHSALTFIPLNEVVFNQNSKDVDFRIESDGNANMLFVDAGNNHVNIGTSADYNGVLNVFTPGNDIALSLASDNGNASVGPILKLTRLSSSPADGDLAGEINFSANNSAAETFLAKITARQDDVSNATEDSSLIFTIRQAGASATALELTNGDTVFNQDGRDRDFRVESGSNSHALFVDAGNNRVGIGAGASPASTLHVANTTEDPYVLVDGSGATRDSGYKINAGGGVDIAIRLDAAGNMFFGPNADIKVDSANNVVINEASANTDFRVESNNNANMLFVDAANDCVNIGTSSSISTQDATLNVNGFGIKSFAINSTTLTDTGISINQEGSGMACMVLASNHYSAGAATRAAQYFLQFYYNGNNAPSVTQVAGTTGLVTFGVSANNTLTVQFPAGGNHISFLMSG